MQIHIIREFKHAGKSVQVYVDPDPINPRTDYDNATIIAHWHPRYQFGTKIERCTEEEMRERAQESGDPILAILPLGLYDHSGLSVNNSTSSGWDSGQVGWIYITQSSAHMMGCEGEGWTEEKYLNAIKSDTKTYDDYLTGSVYGYRIIGADGDVLEDIGGWFGEVENCVGEARTTAEQCEDPAVMRACEELQSRATFAAGM